MRKRTLSREIALQLLYELDITGVLEAESIAAFSKSRRASEETGNYAMHLIEGVRKNMKEIDSKIEEFTKKWVISRMPVVDRNILRIAAFELLFCEDVPPKVAINEAIDLAKRFGGSDSGQFVNAILDKIHSKYGKKQEN